MRVAIAGASGTLGTRLVEALLNRGDEVVRLVRRDATAPDERSWDPVAGTIAAPGLADVDAVVSLSGASIAGWRWSRKYKKQLLDSRVHATQTLVQALRDARAENSLEPSLENSVRPRIFLSASAIGIYGYDLGGRVVTEKSPPGTGFLAHVCEEWEEAAAPAEQLGVRTVFLRTGNVLDPGGGIVAALRLPFLLGLGGRIATGKQWFSWITGQDHVRAQLFLLDHEISGPVNITAPHPVRSRTFVRDFARYVRRPAFIPFPRRAAAVVLSRQMVDETIAAGQRVIPQVLLRAGFRFDQPDLKDAFAWMRSDTGGVTP